MHKNYKKLNLKFGRCYRSSYGILWYNMLHYGILWYIMVYYGILRYIMINDVDGANDRIDR